MKSLNPLKTLALTLSIAGLTACASTGSKPVQTSPTSNLPDWILNPVIENGIADTQCQPATGASMSVLKSMTTAAARAELAKQVDVKVQAMDKSFQEMTQTSDGPVQGGTFTSVARLVTEQNLSGSRAIKMDYVNLPPNNQSNFCVMVGLDPQQSKAMFEDLIDQSKTKGLSPDNKEALYQKFLMSKELKELDELLRN